MATNKGIGYDFIGGLRSSRLPSTRDLVSRKQDKVQSVMYGKVGKLVKRLPQFPGVSVPSFPGGVSFGGGGRVYNMPHVSNIAKFTPAQRQAFGKNMMGGMGGSGGVSVRAGQTATFGGGGSISVTNGPPPDLSWKDNIVIGQAIPSPSALVTAPGVSAVKTLGAQTISGAGGMGSMVGQVGLPASLSGSNGIGSFGGGGMGASGGVTVTFYASKGKGQSASAKSAASKNAGKQTTSTQNFEKPALNKTELEKQVNIEAEKQKWTKDCSFSVVGDPNLAAKKTVSFDGLAGPHNGEWYIVSVTHNWSKGGVYTCSGEGTRKSAGGESPSKSKGDPKTAEKSSGGKGGGKGGGKDKSGGGKKTPGTPKPKPALKASIFR